MPIKIRLIPNTTEMRLLILTLSFFCMALTGTSAKSSSDNRTKVLFKTDKGNITIALYDETPLHKANFIKLVNEHYYDGLLFHRVIKDFMIQTGDPHSRNAAPEARLGEGDPGYTIPAEIKFPQLFHKRGAVAAARQGDMVNPQRNSSGSQFYIVWGKDFSSDELDKLTQVVEQRSRGALKFSKEVKKEYLKTGGTPHLDGAYTVFAEVIDGMKVIDKIQSVRTTQSDRPVNDIRILSAEIINP